MGLLWVSLIVTVVVFVVDGLMWSVVFTKGMEHLRHLSTDEAKAQMGALMGKQLLNTAMFAAAFPYFFSLVQGSLPYDGILNGLLFGVLLWVPGVLHATLNNGIWYGKSRPLATATALSTLVKYLVSGALVASLL